MISVKRWKKQKFTDDFKQECIDIMQGLCKDRSDEYVRETIFKKDVLKAPVIDDESSQQVTHTVDPNSVFVQIVTINVAGNVPQDYRVLLPIIQDTSQTKLADIVVVGLQEVLKASFSSIVGNFLNSNATVENNIDLWKILIVQALNRVNQFRQILD